MSNTTALWICVTIDIVWILIFGTIIYYVLDTNLLFNGSDICTSALIILPGLALISFLARLVINIERIKKIRFYKS